MYTLTAEGTMCDHDTTGRMRIVGFIEYGNRGQCLLRCSPFEHRSSEVSLKVTNRNFSLWRRDSVTPASSTLRLAPSRKERT